MGSQFWSHLPLRVMEREDWRRREVECSQHTYTCHPDTEQQVSLGELALHPRTLTIFLFHHQLVPDE